MAGELPDHLEAAADYLFGAELDRVRAYALLLATEGLTRGLLGPREAERLWDRHLLNSAVLSEVVPEGAQVVDVGSGAGLPGIPLALARSDVEVVLLEPMLRRTTFLTEAVAALGLEERVFVVRGRAPENRADLPFSPDCVTARAVAPLERLVSWTMPLVRQDGALLAIRGASAEEEVRDSGDAVAGLSGSRPEIIRVGGVLLAEPVTVVRVVRRTPPQPESRPRERRAKRRSTRRPR